MNYFVSLLSHDEEHQDLTPLLGAEFRLDVQVRFLKEGLPDGDCRALVVDLDSVAPGRLALLWLVKEMGGRPHPYTVAAFGYNLQDDPINDLNRDTRPPSSSTLTASGSGPAAPAMSASGPLKIDRSVQLPMKIPPTW